MLKSKERSWRLKTSHVVLKLLSCLRKVPNVLFLRMMVCRLPNKEFDSSNLAREEAAETGVVDNHS